MTKLSDIERYNNVFVNSMMYHQNVTPATEALLTVPDFRVFCLEPDTREREAHMSRAVAKYIHDYCNDSVPIKCWKYYSKSR